MPIIFIPCGRSINVCSRAWGWATTFNSIAVKCVLSAPFHSAWPMLLVLILILLHQQKDISGWLIDQNVQIEQNEFICCFLWSRILRCMAQKIALSKFSHLIESRQTYETCIRTSISHQYFFASKIIRYFTLYVLAISVRTPLHSIIWHSFSLFGVKFLRYAQTNTLRVC